MQSRCGVRNDMDMAQPMAKHVPGDQFGEPLSICKGGTYCLEFEEKLPQDAEAGLVKDLPPPAVTISAPSPIIYRTSGKSWSLVWAMSITASCKEWNVWVCIRTRSFVAASRRAWPSEKEAEVVSK